VTDERRIERTLGFIALGLVAGGCLAVLWPFGSSIIWALIIAFSTWPVFVRLELALGGRTALAAVLMTLIIAVILMIPLVLVVFSMSDSVASLVALLRDWLEAGPPGPPGWVATLPLIGPRLSDRWAQIATDGHSLTAALTPYLGTARTWLLTLAGTLGGGIAHLLLSLLITAVIYTYGAALARRLDTGLRRIDEARGRRFVGIVASTIRSVVYGVLGSNLIQAAIAVVGFWIAGVPGALVLGMLAFFLTLIPMACNVLWVPAVIWLVVEGNIGRAIFLGIWCAINFGILESVLRAWLVGRSSEMPLMLLLFGMLGGLVAFGLLGLLIGPTVLALGFSLVSEWSAGPAPTPELPSSAERKPVDAAAR